MAETESPPELLRIPFSTYCRKTEWGITQTGIDYTTLDVSIPGMRNIKRANPWERTVPVLHVGGRIIPGSHRILAWADAHRLPAAPSLFPQEHEKEVEAWETWTDDHLGPLLRREVYRILHKEVRHYGKGPWSTFKLWLIKPGFRYAARYYRATTYDADDRAATHAALTRTLDRLRESGTGYLFTTHATAADHATAAFWEPVVRIAGPLGIDKDDGWGELVQYVRTVKPRRTTRSGGKRARSKDWDRLQAAVAATPPPTA